MSMDIFQDLLTGSQSGRISAELLETLGTQAAQRHLKDGANLNETIRELIAQHPGIQNEHTKRIAEFANNSVFQELHSKSDDKNVHFDVADPGVIIRDLKDGGSPAHDGKTLQSGAHKDKHSDVPSVGDGDYRRPPGESMSQAPDQGFQDFDSAFTELTRQDQNSGMEGTGEPIAKTAATLVDHQLHANPVEDVYDTHIRLRAAKTKLAEAHERFDLLLKTAEEEYYQAAKHEVLAHGGAGMAGVIQATKLAAPSNSVAFKALRKVAERLVAEGVPGDELTKAASVERLLNPEHPLVRAFAGLVKTAEEKTKSAIALSDVQGGLEKTSAFLQSA